jgi:hypothetical protein
MQSTVISCSSGELFIFMLRADVVFIWAEKRFVFQAK